MTRTDTTVPAHPVDNPGVKVFIPFLTNRDHRSVAAPLADTFRQRSWRIPGKTERGARRLAEEVAQWVRFAIADGDRPGSPSHVGLALTCRDIRGRVVHSDSLGVFEPTVFRTGDGATRIESFLAEVRFKDPGSGAQLVAALLHIGDVAHLTAPPRTA